VLASQQDVEMLYQTKFVRALLEYQLPPIKSAVIKWQLIPYLLYLSLFIVYAVYFFEQHNDGTPDDA